MDAIRALRTLRVLRDYDPRPIPEGVLDDMLAVARWTGTASNNQLVRYVVVRDRGTLQQIADSSASARRLAEAPLAIVPVTRAGGRLWDAIDLGRATERLMVAAHAHGVGSCIQAFNGEESKRLAARLLALPSDMQADYAIALGYPAAKPQPRPAGAVVGRKPIDEIVFHETYGSRR